jgi:hypothetical protein
MKTVGNQGTTRTYRHVKKIIPENEADYYILWLFWRRLWREMFHVRTEVTKRSPMDMIIKHASRDVAFSGPVFTVLCSKYFRLCNSECSITI